MKDCKTCIFTAYKDGLTYWLFFTAAVEEGLITNRIIEVGLKQVLPETCRWLICHFHSILKDRHRELV